MTYVFIVCAALGGTVLVLQFLMTLIGLGGHAFDADMPQDMGHGFGGDFHADTGGDFHGDADGDFHGEGGLHGDASGDHPGADGADQAGHHGALELFRVLSFRTIIAAMAFFGLGGLAAQSAQADTPTVLVVALAAGGVAMAAVYWMMRGLQELRSDGTVRVQRAVGQHGNVYLRVPANRSGSGKIQFNLQNRTMEYLAVTSGPELLTGTKVVVVGVVNPTTLEVQAES
jgi:hypothetical protein